MRELNQHIDQLTARSSKSRPVFTADRCEQCKEKRT